MSERSKDIPCASTSDMAVMYNTQAITSKDHQLEISRLCSFLHEKNEYTIFTCWETTSSWLNDTLKFSEGIKVCNKCEFFLTFVSSFPRSTHSISQQSHLPPLCSTSHQWDPGQLWRPRWCRFPLSTFHHSSWLLFICCFQECLLLRFWPTSNHCMQPLLHSSLCSNIRIRVLDPKLLGICQDKRSSYPFICCNSQGTSQNRSLL